MIVLPLSRSDSSTVVAQNGKYYTTLQVGTPNVSFDFLISSASVDTLLAGSSCTPRCDYSPSYSPDSSSSSSPLCSGSSCSFIVNFPQHDATVAGSAYLDLLSLGPASLPTFPLGAWTSIRNLHLMVPAPMSAILGLLPAEGPLAPRLPATNSSLLSQLLAVGAIPDPSLALCLGDYGGLLLLGGTDPALHRGDLQTALLDADTLGMGLLALAVNSAPLVLPHSLVAQLNPAVVDTTFHETVLPSDAFNLLAQAMLPYCSAATPGLCEDGFFSGRCYFIDPPALSDYPTITLTLEGLQGTVALALGPTQWLSFVNKKGYCLAISPSSLTGTRVGTQALTGYYALLNYSLDSPSVAFAPSTNCTGAQYTLALVSGNKQRGPVGTAAKQKLVVRVLELGSGMPVTGVYVNFQIVQGAAALGNIMPSDAEGYASVEMRFGFVEGLIQIVANLDLAIPANIVFLAESQKPVAYVILSGIFTGLLTIGFITIYFISNRHRKLQAHKFINSPVYDLLVDR